MTIALTDSAPAFALHGTDGHTHSLADYADAAALVVIQTCNHCPYAQAWEGRINAIQTDYAERGVRIVAINSNDAASHPEDSFPEMVTRATEQGYTFDYLHDDDQSLARALGAQRTPEVYVFGADRRLAYHGAVDDNRDDQAVTQHYLRDALDAVLAGRAPSPSETSAVGCSVKWRA